MTNKCKITQLNFIKIIKLKTDSYKSAKIKAFYTLNA